MTRLTVPFSLVAIVLAGCVGADPSFDDPSARLVIVSRADWGWIDTDKRLPEHTIDKITVHHGGTPFDEDRDTAEYLRSLQKWSRNEKDWMDVPYHYVVDLQGRIFEGRPIRFPGDTNTTYNPTGHALVVVTGNYDERELSVTQLASLTRLLLFLVRRHSVNPNAIKGHKDYAPDETACPGAGIYRYIESGHFIHAAPR